MVVQDPGVLALVVVNVVLAVIVQILLKEAVVLQADVTHLINTDVNHVRGTRKIVGVVEMPIVDLEEREMVMALVVLVKTEVVVVHDTLPLLQVEIDEIVVPTNIVAQEDLD